MTNDNLPNKIIGFDGYGRPYSNDTCTTRLSNSPGINANITLSDQDGNLATVIINAYTGRVTP